MWRPSSHWGYLTVVSLGLLAAPAGAVAPVVKDEGKFFSPETVQKANEEIRDIARQSGRDLLVETYASAPGAQLDKVKDMSREEKVQFFRSWAARRTDAAVVNGVYILVCRNPAYYYVAVTPSARQAFDGAATRKLRQLLDKDFRDKRFDDALLETTKFVREQLGGTKESPGR